MGENEEANLWPDKVKSKPKKKPAAKKVVKKKPRGKA